MKILIAYDGSTESKRALEWASTLAQSLAGSTVSVISIAPALEAADPIADAVDPSSDVQSHQAHLAVAATTLKAAGLEPETILRIGRPAEEILDAADDGEFDLITLGSRGVGSARRFLMGSVSERVVRHSSRPVLVVR